MMFELTVVHRVCGSLTLSRFTALFVEVGTKQSIAQRCVISARARVATPDPKQFVETSEHGGRWASSPPASSRPQSSPDSRSPIPA